MVKNNTTVLLALLIAAMGLAVQFVGFINLDNAWLLDAAGRFVNGEELNAQVVETNPPLIIYLMSLPVMAARILHVSAINCFISFIGLLGVTSLALIYAKVKDNLLWLFIVFGVFLLPAAVFGEREHIMVILILPYFVARWEDQKPHFAYRLLAGVMAGIGFSLKPFFVIIWVAIVVTRVVNSKSWKDIFQFENFIIGFTGVFYLAYLFLIEHNYINFVLPLLMKYYGIFGANRLTTVKNVLAVGFSYQVATLVVFIKAREHLTRRIYLCCAACLSSVALIFIQNKSWMNYFYPPLFFSLLSYQMIIATLFNNLRPLWNKVAVILCAIIIIILVMSSVYFNSGVAWARKDIGSERLIGIFNKYANGKAVYPLSFDLGAIYPQVIYSKAHNVSRFGHLWMLPGIYKRHARDGIDMRFNLPQERSTDEAMVVATLVSDFKNYSPEVVAVSDKEYNNAGIDYKFNFIKYLSVDPEFKEMWKQYHLIGYFNDQFIYRRIKQTDPKQ